MPNAFAARGKLETVQATSARRPVLHRERLDRGKKRLHALPMPLATLPDGAMVQQGEESFLVMQGRALLWSPAGYAPDARALERPMLLTPPSTLRAIVAGYQPVLHPTARSQRGG